MPVLRPDGTIVNLDPTTHVATPGWQETTTDGAGNLTYNYQLDGIQGLYTARVYPVDWNGDWSQTPIAETTFTDAAQAAADQCQNGSDIATRTTGCDVDPSDWGHGNLGASKSAYFEGDTIPYRIVMSGLANGTHTISIEWDTTKSSKHALDYITTFNNTVATANPCLGVTNCGPLQAFGPLTHIPADPQVTGAGVTPIAGDFALYGGTITSVSVPASVGNTTCDATNSLGSYCYSTGTGFTGDKSAAIKINFTANQSNPVLAWGGHISTRGDWGPPTPQLASRGRRITRVWSIWTAPVEAKTCRFLPPRLSSPDRSTSLRTRWVATERFHYTASPSPLG